MRKKKKVLRNLPSNLEVEDVSFIIEAEPKPLEIESACSFSMSYGNNGIPSIHIKTYGEVDLTKLKQMIQERYPEAKLKVLQMPEIELNKPAKPKRKKRKKSVKSKKRKK